MATKAGPNTGKSSSKTSAARKRAPAKPVIIDVEADKAAKAPEKPTAATARSAGLDEATARAAGLSASGPAPKTATKATPDEAPKLATPAASDDAAGTPRAFVLAAAGFIGALAALALMFLAQTLGLVNAPNGQLDVQRAALVALEERVDTRLASLEAAGPTQAAAAQTEIDLAPLETELAQLRDDMEQLIVLPASDAAPINFDALIADALVPLEERIGAIEAVIQFPGPLLDEPSQGAAESGPAGSPASDPASDLAGDPAPAVDPEELVELRDQIATASAEIAALRADFTALANTENPDTQQIAVLDERLTQMSTDTAGRLETLSMRVAELGDGVATMSDELTAFEQAPIAVAPDQLARLGLALDGLAAARDSGTGLADALAAAQAASAFDGELSGALAPLSSLAEGSGLNDAALLARYESAAGAMRDAAPGSTQESSGLLGALGERARQMVTIRAPGDASSDAPGTLTGQIDQLGSLVASRQYEAALASFDSLPDAVKAAGSDVHDALGARVSLDNALNQARSGLLAALASSNQ